MGALGALNGDVDDAEPDFRLGPARAATSRTVTFGEPNLFRAPRPVRSLTSLSTRNLATGRVFGTSASLLCPPSPACRADLRPRNVYRRPFSPRLREKPGVG